MIIVRERLYVPTDDINLKKAKRRYTTKLYDESACMRCDYRPMRHCYVCDTCNAYLSETRTYKLKEHKGVSYIGLPLGDRHYFEKLGVDYDEHEVVDLRCKEKFSVPIKFTGKLYDYQKPVVEEFLSHKYGILEAPPRSGKTIMSLYIAIRLGRRTLILANQIEFLQQFEDHVRQFTNLPELEKKLGRKLFGIAKTKDDFKNFEICMSTYQRFLSPKGKKLLKYVLKRFGTVGIDEVHKGNAESYSAVLAKIYAKHLLGVTGTVERKDGRQFLVRQIIGPVVAKSERESLTPIVYVHDTGLKPRHEHKHWTYANRWLANNEDRNEMIIDMVLNDLQADRSIVLPSYFKQHVMYLKRRINSEWGSKIAEHFIGGNDKRNKQHRIDVLERAKAGEIRVVVGIRSLLQLGLNVPRWDTLYVIMPISNEPNLKQETSRVRTPMEGKKTPIIRWFVDPTGVSSGCFRSSFFQLRKFGYDFDPGSHDAIKRHIRFLKNVNSGPKGRLSMPTNNENKGTKRRF
jgi:superfamily II DNA or RNA helicase